MQLTVQTGKDRNGCFPNQENAECARGGKMGGSLRDLYVEELKDLYNAENQLVKALPKMAKHATSDELRSAFEDHLEQTKEHVERLEQVFDSLGEKQKGKKCAGMEGLVEEGGGLMKENFDGPVMDAALISAAQRVEHYEIAAYGTLCAYADLLGKSDQVSLLRETLQEEKETDQKLTELSRDINAEAAEASERGRQKRRRAA
jgi:ferritin-like metal-binding protein YciE